MTDCEIDKLPSINNIRQINTKRKSLSIQYIQKRKIFGHCRSKSINYLLKQSRNEFLQNIQLQKQKQSQKRKVLKKCYQRHRFATTKQRKVDIEAEKNQKGKQSFIDIILKMTIQNSIKQPKINYIIQKKQLISMDKPPQRFKTAMCYENEKIYIYGGIGCDQHIKFAQFNRQTKKWRFHIEQNNLYNPLIPLTGHTFCSNRGKGYIFGGMLRDVTNFLQIINLKTFKITDGPKCNYRRQDHAAVMIGKYMFIHGGIDRDQVKNDLFYYDTQNNYWGYFSRTNNDLPYLSHHSMTTSFSYKNKKKITCLSDITDHIYIFGGKNKFGNSTNDLYKLILEHQNVIVQKVYFTFGPQKRFSCCFHFLKNGMLTVYGGKYQNQGQRKQQDQIYNNLYVFNLIRNEWSVQQTTQPLDKRFGMSSASNYDDKIFIFGGFVEDKYANPNITVLGMYVNQSFKSKKIFQTHKQLNRSSIHSKKRIKTSSKHLIYLQ